MLALSRTLYYHQPLDRAMNIFITCEVRRYRTWQTYRSHRANDNRLPDSFLGITAVDESGVFPQNAETTCCMLRLMLYIRRSTYVVDMLYTLRMPLYPQNIHTTLLLSSLDSNDAATSHYKSNHQNSGMSRMRPEAIQNQSNGHHISYHHRWSLWCI